MTGPPAQFPTSQFPLPPELLRMLFGGGGAGPSLATGGIAPAAAPQAAPQQTDVQQLLAFLQEQRQRAQEPPRQPGLLGQLLGDRRTGLLSPEQERQIGNQSLIQAGLTTLAGADAPPFGQGPTPGLGRALAGGFASGREAFQRGTQRALQSQLGQQLRAGGQSLPELMQGAIQAIEFGDVDAARALAELARLQTGPDAPDPFQNIRQIGNRLVELFTDDEGNIQTRDLITPQDLPDGISVRDLKEGTRPNGDPGFFYLRRNPQTGAVEPEFVGGALPPASGLPQGTANAVAAANAFGSMVQELKDLIGPGGEDLPGTIDRFMAKIPLIKNFASDTATRFEILQSAILLDIQKARSGLTVTENERRLLAGIFGISPLDSPRVVLQKMDAWEIAANQLEEAARLGQNALDQKARELVGLGVEGLSTLTFPEEPNRFRR